MNTRVWIGVVIVGMVIIIKTPLVFSLFALFVLGMIPGTSLAVPAWVLLVVYPVLFVAVLAWTRTQLRMGAQHATPPAVKTSAAKRAPRRHATRTTRKPTAVKRRSEAAV